MSLEYTGYGRDFHEFPLLSVHHSAPALLWSNSLLSFSALSEGESAGSVDLMTSHRN